MKNIKPTNEGVGAGSGGFIVLNSINVQVNHETK